MISKKFVSQETTTFVVGGREVIVPERCPHKGAPLAEGTIKGMFLECPWHGATFDLRTGRRLRGPQCPDIVVAHGENDRDEN